MTTIFRANFCGSVLIGLLIGHLCLGQNNAEDESVEQKDFDRLEPEKIIGQVSHPTNDDDDAGDDETETINAQIRPDENDVVVDNRRTEDDTGKTKHILPNADETLSKPGANFYSYAVVDIEGKTVHLKKYRNTVSLVVNVASECGFTDGHYKALVRMQNMLSASGKFNVLAFPCNQFGAQEPGEEKQIFDFLKERYQVNFPMFSKIQVLDYDVPAAWQYLQEQSGRVPNWNFWKYLVDEDGNVVDAWGPWTTVEEIFERVKAAVDRIAKPRDPVLPELYADGQVRTEL